MALDLEEQEQLDEARVWWKQHGNKVIWGVTAFLLLAAGWKFWHDWSRKQAIEASALYDQAVQAASLGDSKTAKAVAAQIMDNHGRSAYATPAAWLSGRINLDAGDAKSASAQYQFALDHAQDAGGKQLARLRLASIKLDEKDAAGALKLLDDGFDPAFQGLAAHLKGDILMSQNKPAEAKVAYQEALAKLGEKSPLKPLVEIRLDALGG
jgi:predicted negative regulator of RcsB-dependent stress response